MKTLPASDEVVADLGAGERPYETLVRQRGWSYLACDLGHAADVEITPGRRLNIDDHSVGGVMSIQVLEHVWDLDWYLGECRRILKPGGWLVLSTHGVWLYHPHPTDFRRWTADGLRAELECRGFEVLSIRGLVGPLAWTTQFRALGVRHVLLTSRLGQLLVRPLMLLFNARMVIEDWVTPEEIIARDACIYLAICRVRG